MATRSSLRAARLVARQQHQQAVRSLSSSASTSFASSSAHCAAPEASSSSFASSSGPSQQTASSSWKPLLAPGVLPAYDEAVAFLQSRAVPATEPSIQAVNSPETVAAFARGDYDASLPIHRHLRESTWRDTGILDKVMQRCTLMRVLPDALPSITPTVDVQVAFGQGQGFGDHGGSGGDVLAGVFLDPQATIERPEIRITAFHEDTRHYTVAVVDLDSPDVEGGLFTTKLHLLKTDVPVSATTHQQPIDVEGASALQSWIPPHPQKGSPYHRYVTVVFEQSKPFESGAAVTLSPEQRHDFDLAQFAADHGLTATGIHFFRQKWSEENGRTVSRIYKEILGAPEPKFSHPPRMEKVRKQIGVQGSKFINY